MSGDMDCQVMRSTNTLSNFIFKLEDKTETVTKIYLKIKKILIQNYYKNLSLLD